MCFCVQVIIGEICGGLSFITSVSRGENPLVVEILLQYLSPFWASPNFLLHAWLWKIIIAWNQRCQRNRLGVSRSWDLKMVLQHINLDFSVVFIFLSDSSSMYRCVEAQSIKLSQTQETGHKTEWFWLSKIRKHLGSTYCWHSRSVCNKD